MFKKILIAFVVLLVLAWVFLAFVGVEPKDRRPGTLLSGTPTLLPEDRSFLNSDIATEVHLETHPWYGIPFSVTTVIAEDSGDVFIPSLYGAVMDFPGRKYWNSVVQANPDVRLQVDGKLYELAIYPINDAQEFERAFSALARKYPFWAKKLAERDDTRRDFALLKLRARS